MYYRVYEGGNAPTRGGRSFTFTAPALWNSLPADLRVVTTLKLTLTLKTFCLGVHLQTLLKETAEEKNVDIERALNMQPVILVTIHVM